MASSLIAAADPPSSHEENSVCIAWIDASVLTRECLTHAVGKAQRLFMIVPFESVYDCLKGSERALDLIVYHAHDASSVNVADIITLRQAFGSTQLVILSDAVNLDPAVVKELLLQGASGFILTSQTGVQMMVSALAMVASGGTFVPREVLFYEDSGQSGVKAPRRGRLTARELEVLALLKLGKPNKLIAYELHLSESTVKVHIRNTMRKMGSTNRTQVAMTADSFLEARAA